MSEKTYTCKGPGGGLDYPSSIAVTPDGKHVYVANDNNHSVSVIDTVSSTVVNNIPVFSSPYPVALTVTPDGKHVYVTDGTYYVTVIDTATYGVNQISLLPITSGGDFASIVAAPDGKHVYLTNSFSNDVFVIDTATNALSSFYVGGYPQGLAVTPNSQQIYVTNYYPINTVSVIDTAAPNARSLVVGSFSLPWSVAMPMAVTPTHPTSKDQCKNGGWKAFGFKDQGQCIKYVNTGK